MSAQTERSKSFIRAINDATGRYFDPYRPSMEVGDGCFYDGGPYSRRDYVLDLTVKNWDAEKSQNLRKKLKAVGAVNIIGKMQKACCRNYLDWAFNIDPRKLPEYLAKDEEARRIAAEMWAKEEARREAEKKAERKAARAAKKAAKKAMSV